MHIITVYHGQKRALEINGQTPDAVLDALRKEPVYYHKGGRFFPACTLDTAIDEILRSRAIGTIQFKSVRAA